MTKIYLPPVPTKSFQPIKIDVVEKEYNATYVGDFCLKTKDGSWTNFPVAIFYNPKPPKPEYSNYLGVFVTPENKIYITDGASAFLQPIIGIIADNGDVIISRYRHDYVTSADGSVFIDGGRDYVRCSVHGETIQLFMVDGVLTTEKPIKKTKLTRNS